VLGFGDSRGWKMIRVEKYDKKGAFTGSEKMDILFDTHLKLMTSGKIEQDGAVWEIVNGKICRTEVG
jgi:hypothetical protein